MSDTTLAQCDCLNGLSRLTGHGVEPNYEDAIYFFNKAGNAGEARAIYELGHMQAKGIGSRINHSKAKEYFTKAAKLNEPNALFVIADGMLKSLEQNVPPPTNADHSATLSKTNVNQQSMAISMSGTLPANTTFTASANLDKRVRTALRILKLAADQEHGLANATLGHIYETGGYED